MRKIDRWLCTLLLIALLFMAMPATQARADPFEDFTCKAALLIDAATGQVLYEKNADAPLPIASLTKIMTLLIAFDEIDVGNLSMDEVITVSDRAASMGGSQAFLDAGGQYKVSELIKSIVIASANDSSVAIAERISGSVEAFVERMNGMAADLGMQNTSFKNCTGLPAQDHYSSARDIAVMSRLLCGKWQFFEYSRIWMDEMEHANARITELVNTNRLIRFYDGADGIKTGSTSDAGYCLSASAVRGNMRLISVVLGAPSTAERFAQAARLMDHGYANWTLKSIIAADEILAPWIPVKGGKVSDASAKAAQGFQMVCPINDAPEFTITVEYDSPLQAPIAAGQQIGKIVVLDGEVVVGEVPLVAIDDVPLATYQDVLGKVFQFWVSAAKR